MPPLINQYPPQPPTGLSIWNHAAFAITIHGKPIAKKRPRFARIGKGVRTYSAQETEEGRVMWEIKAAWEKAWGGDPLKCPIYLLMYFGMYIPASTSKKLRRLMLSGDIKHTKKPDVDNLQKFYKDCMNGIVWHDDSQVFRVVAEKYYVEEPFTFIKVFDLSSE